MGKPPFPPQHLKLQHLIPLAAQLAAAEHLGSDDLGGADHGIRKQLKEAALRLCDHEGALPDAFSTLRKTIKASVEGKVVSKAFANDLKTLKKSLSERSCRHCKEGGPPCRRDQENHGKVDAGGICITTIRNIYRDICDDARRRWIEVFGNGPTPGLQFVTMHLAAEDKRVIYKNFSVTGTARILDASSPVTAIVLGIYDEPFDWEQFILVPYLLYHEVTCHGFQDVYDPAGEPVPKSRRKSADPDCFWSEGWMDTAAYNLAGKWLRDNGARYSISNERRVRIANNWNGNLHDARYGLDGKIMSETRHFGRLAFEQVQKSLLRTGLSDAEADSLILRFSLLLNAIVVCGLPLGKKANERRTEVAMALDRIAVGPDPVQGRLIMERFLDSRSVAELPG